MAVPTTITDLSVTAASNVPSGTDTVTTTTGPDEYFRAHAAIIKEACATVYTATGADTITFSTTPTFAAYAAGMRFHFIAAGANTGAATLNINSLGAKAVTKEGTTALAAGDIASGAVVCVEYDGTRFQLVSGRSVQPLDSTLTALAGTLTAANKIPYATALNTAGELDLSTSTSLGTSDTTLSSQKAVKTYVDTAVAGVSTLTAGTAQASTSGTSIDFTGIPSGTKRITVMFVGLSTNGTSVPIIQLGDSGGFETTGYLGTASAVAVSATASTAFTTGFGIVSAQAAASVLHGTAILTLVNSATNTWTGIISIGRTDSTANYFFGGSKSLSATLTQIRITTVNGTDAFDAGEINILYE